MIVRKTKTEGLPSPFSQLEEAHPNLVKLLLELVRERSQEPFVEQGRCWREGGKMELPQLLAVSREGLLLWLLVLVA